MSDSAGMVSGEMCGGGVGVGGGRKMRLGGGWGLLIIREAVLQFPLFVLFFALQICLVSGRDSLIPFHGVFSQLCGLCLLFFPCL